MTANRELLHQTGWAAFELAGSRQGRVGRRCSRAFEKVGLDSEPVGEILGNAGEESIEWMRQMISQQTAAAISPLGQTTRKFKAGGDCDLNPCAWPEICISVGGEPRDVSLRNMLFSPFAH